MGYRDRGYSGRRDYGSGRSGGRGGGSYGGNFRPSPVELGKEYEADIIEMSHRGDAGVAKIQGLVVFVSGAKVGQHVRFVITRVARRYATAELVHGTEGETSEKTTEEGEDEE